MNPILALFLLFIVFILIFYFIIFKFGDVPCRTNVCLTDKTAVVTGGSSGLGYEIVLKLASRGCKVIIADKVVNDDIKKSIFNETRNPKVVLEYVDFGSFKSVREFAEKLNKSEEKLDILVNNVGIGKGLDTPTEDGLNLTMQVNYYSTFLLTHLLIGLLKKSEQGRIIFTASVGAYVHLMFSNSLTNNGIKNLPPPLRIMNYPNSKFCNVVASKIFAEKLKKWNITSNVYHPGIVQTNIWRDTQAFVNGIFDMVIYYTFFYPLPKLYGKSPERACQAAVELVVSNEFSKVSGTFFGKFFPNFLPRAAHDEVFCNKIWKATEKMVKLKPEEKLD